jgi:methylmalonyl-CoA mutase N-terminal domain/subunit
MTINATASILLAYYVAVAIERGLAPSTLSGTTQNDILKEYVARGTQAYPPRPSLGLVTGMIAYTARDLPRWNPISISGYHMREAGATAVQELAFTLANGLEYARGAMAAGLPIDAFAPRLSFFFACHNDFFEEIAKFRAARRLWAGLMKERLGATRPESWKLRFHTQTAGSTLAAQEAQNNVVRVALQAMAAVLGGTQSLHCNALDEALALPTEATARLALRTQQVIAFESGVADVADPLGGSWFVENLTDQVAREASALIEEVERIGGALRAVETGFYAQHIDDSAFRHQREVDRGDRTIVGVNRFADDDASTVPNLHLHRGEVGASQRDRVATTRATRDRMRVLGALDRVREAARASLQSPGTPHVMDALIEGALARATTGELAAAMRDVFGAHRAHA